MNNIGQSFFIAILVAVMIFSAGMLAMNFVKDDVSIATTSLDCNNASISDGNKVTCLAMDAAVPYLFIIILSAAGGLIASKLTL